MAFTAEQLKAIQEARKVAHLAKAEEIQKSLQVLPGGAMVYKDSPPGVGFVLEAPKHPKRYLATPEKAVARWEELRGQGLTLVA